MEYYTEEGTSSLNNGSDTQNGSELNYEEEGEDELPIGDTEDEEQDPFEDFDEDDFDDDFDDDFEEELDDEYEIEPADDGLVPGAVEDIDEEILDEEEEIEPGISDVD